MVRKEGQAALDEKVIAATAEDVPLARVSEAFHRFAQLLQTLAQVRGDGQGNAGITALCTRSK